MQINLSWYRCGPKLFYVCDDKQLQYGTVHKVHRNHKFASRTQTSAVRTKNAVAIFESSIYNILIYTHSNTLKGGVKEEEGKEEEKEE